MTVSRYNEVTLLAAFTDEPQASRLPKCRALASSIERRRLPGVRECWHAFEEVAVEFDPEAISYEELSSAVSRPDFAEKIPVGINVEIPVVYDRHSQDIHALSENLNIGIDEIISLHTGTRYEVAAIGFLPGFPYLQGLPKRLHHPRKSKPSVSIPAGSVAVGGSQTGIYPFESPGGWYVLGRANINLFMPPDRFLLSSGDSVVFKAV